MLFITDWNEKGTWISVDPGEGTPIFGHGIVVQR